jgi:hypothetical protein
MPPTDQEKLRALEQRYKELAKIPFKSDEELEQLDQVEHEIDFLKAKLDKEQNPTEQLEQVEHINFTPQKPGTKQKKSRFLSPDDQLKYDQLKQKERLIDDKLKLHKLETEVEKKQEKLKEIQKEDRYITKKPDKEGIIQLEQHKYEKRIAELQAQLEKATTWREKNRISSEIQALKMTKVQVKINNASIKMGRGVQGFSKFVNQLGNSLGNLSKFSGYDNKAKSAGDFGFNDKIFDMGKKNKKNFGFDEGVFKY